MVPATYRRKNGILDEWCAKVGRDPGEIERTSLFNRQQLERVDELVAAGATHLIYRIGTQAPWDLSVVEQLLAWRDQRNGT